MSSDARGFTLLEAVIAFMIAASATVVLFQIYGSAATGGDRSAQVARASEIARDRLERVGVEFALEPGLAEGETEDGYLWRTVIEPYDDGASARPSSNEPPSPLLEVAVQVGTARADQYLTELRTLRLKTGGSRDAPL